jgi:glucosamine--fructose-6-phosphate aminotransferase (isomerizing)
MWWYKNSDSPKNEYRDNLFNDLKMDLQELPNAIRKTIEDNSSEIKNLANILHKEKHIFILGRGLLYPIALESALKIKEVSYIHAEGFCGGALKHGPFALIEDGTPIFILSNDDSHSTRMESAAEEVLCRGAFTILFTNNNDKLNKRTIYKYCIEIPKIKVLSALLTVIPMQMLSYEIGIKKGVTVDQPKSLAKVVTVDG